MESIYTFNLPDIGEGVVEGEVVQWLKKKGEPVRKDEPVVVVMTDKATVELPSPVEGTLDTLCYKEGDIAKVGAPLYSVLTREEIKETKHPCPIKEEKSERKAPVIHEKKESGKPSQKKAIPKVRKIAKDLNIDLDLVEGTGREGRITLQDLSGALAKQRPLPGKEPFPSFKDDTVEKVVGIPRLMAEKMAISKRIAPHFSYFEQIDATRLIQLKESFKKAAEGEGIKITFMPFIIKAVSLSLLQYPKVNSTFDMERGELYIHKHHNIGVAIATPLGLIVPVLSDVQNMPLETIIRSYDSLVKRAREKNLHPDEMKGSTITVSNFGGLEGSGRWATPVINYPEVAILAINRIQKAPMVKGDSVVVRDALNISWSFDHRVIDGNLAAAVSHYFATLIQNPAKLMQSSYSLYTEIEPKVGF